MILAVLIGMCGQARAGDGEICTPDSKKILANLNVADVAAIQEFLVAPHSLPRLPSVIFKWPRGIRVMFTGLASLSDDDVGEVRKAKKAFARTLGPDVDFLGFRDLLGDPFADRSADRNFLIFFYDSAREQPRDWETVGELLTYTLGATVPPSVVEGFHAHLTTFVEVHPNADGTFDRALAVVDLSEARPAGLSKVLYSLLSIATSPALTERGPDWIDGSGRLLPDREKAIRSYIAFIYCAGIQSGTTLDSANHLLNSLVHQE